MVTATEILTLAQWFSPTFPVGSFAYSHGLEWDIESGTIKTGADVQDWISLVLRDGAGWNDCLLLAAAYRAEGDPAVAEIDATSRALAASRERLQETVQQGASFCRAVSGITRTDLYDLTYPVAVGRAARLENLPLDVTAQHYLQAFISNLVSVAMRLVPLGQTEGQVLIHALAPSCIDFARRALAADLNDLSATTFLCDIAAMKHETQYSRIFRT
jgi:urease accessory protein